MIFTRSSRKQPAKESSDSARVSFDLLSNLTYMAALSTGGLSRDIILEWAIRQHYKTAIYFRQVYLLTKRLGFEYASAFRLTAKKAAAKPVKNLLLRFAGAIISGVSESEFLAEEARIERAEYINSYHRGLEALSKWGDAYAALLVSVTLVVVVAMISTMLSNMGNAFVLMLTGSMVLVTSFGVYIIYRTAPYEIKTYQNGKGPVERRWAKRLLVTVFPVGAVFSLFLGYSHGMGLFILGLGFALLPAGIMAWRDNGKVNNVDGEAASFIRSLGNVTSALNSTLATALSKIDTRSLTTLEPYLRRLQVRLRSQIDPEKCWDAFRDETGSELINRSTRMFVDGVALGGPPEKVGAITAEYAMDAALLRARRTASAAPLALLTIPLHFAMTALLLFVLEVIKAFNSRIAAVTEEIASRAGSGDLSVMPALPVFQTQDLSMMTTLTMVALLSLTVCNALAPKFAMGGHATYTCVFGAITCIMTGLNILVIPKIASGIMSSGPA